MPSAPTGGTLTLNAIEMLSGSGALYGKAVQEGFQLAADTVNGKGGVMGMKLEVAVLDNASDDAQTSTLVKKFADDRSVGVIIPPTYQPNFNVACSASHRRRPADRLRAVLARPTRRATPRACASGPRCRR